MKWRQLGRDAVWGMAWGLFGGVVLMLFAVAVVYGIKGGFANAPEGVTPLTLFPLHPAGGICAGFIVGLFRPYLRTRKKAMLVGMVAALPVSIAFNLMSHGPIEGWGKLGIFATVCGAVLLGGMAGYIWWGQLHNW